MRSLVCAAVIVVAAFFGSDRSALAQDCGYYTSYYPAYTTWYGGTPYYAGYYGGGYWPSTSYYTPYYTNYGYYPTSYSYGAYYNPWFSVGW